MEDAADIVVGVYPALMSVEGITTEKGLGKGAMGHRGVMTRAELNEIRFYPLPTMISPIITLFLKAKEVNYLLYRLQQSLDIKMDNENTRPLRDRFRERQEQERAANKWFEQMLKDNNMHRLPNGKIITMGGEAANETTTQDQKGE